MKDNDDEKNVVTVQPGTDAECAMKALEAHGIALHPSILNTANERPRIIGNSWVARPVISKCPQGMEYLQYVDMLRVYVKTNPLEMITNRDVPNKYFIMNRDDRQVYYGFEDAEFFLTQPESSTRGYKIQFEDYRRRKCLTIRKDPSAKAGCTLQSQALSNSWVESANGSMVGSVIRKSSLLSVNYLLLDRSERTIGQLKGRSLCRGLWSGDTVYPITSSDTGTQFATITRKGCESNVTRTYMFEIKFSTSLDVQFKTLLLATCLLVDFDCFDRKYTTAAKTTGAEETKVMKK